MSETPGTTESPRQDPPPNGTGGSAVYAKLSPSVRYSLDQAIVDHDPPTYRAIYNKFDLDQQGVGFWSFYRYAINLRSLAEKHHIAELVLPDDAHLENSLPRLIAHRLFQTLLYEEKVPLDEVQRLTNAYRAVSLIALAREKSAAVQAAADRHASEKESNDFLKQANQYLAIAQADLKARQAELK
jgi:hypothetical protein